MKIRFRKGEELKYVKVNHKILVGKVCNPNFVFLDKVPANIRARDPHVEVMILTHKN